MKYFTYGCEDYKGNKSEVTVKAHTEAEAWNRLKDYEVSKGELHYAWLKSISDTGEEKYYQREIDRRGTALFIALAGAALGCSQINTYGQNKNYLDCLKDDVIIDLI